MEQEFLSAMLYHEQSEDYRPLFWLGGRPIYACAFLIILHVIAFVAVALALSFWGEQVYNTLPLDSYLVLHHAEVWRLASYIVFPPSLWFVFAMGFLYFAGREVEQFVGRTIFLKLYAALVFIPATIICLISLVFPQQTPIFGGTETVFGVFVAFATIYPGVVINIWFVNLTNRDWAFVLLGVYSLIDFAGHAWASLMLLWLCAGVGYASMRLIGAGRGLNWLTDWIEERRARKLARERNFKIVREQQATESIDAILDKISKHGVDSLDAKEKAALEQARTKLIQRDRR